MQRKTDDENKLVWLFDKENMHRTTIHATME